MPWMIPRLLKNLFGGPVTVRYPFEKKPPVPEVRGKLSWEMSKCDLCGDCQRLCPSNAIIVDEANRKIIYDPFSCIYCRTCAEGCFHGAILCSVEYAPPNTQKSTEVYEKKEVPVDVT